MNGAKQWETARPGSLAADRSRLLRRLVAGLLGLALGAFLALALSPRSNWLVALQLSGWAVPEPNGQSNGARPISRSDLARAIEHMPNDGEAQAAWLNYNLQNSGGPEVSDVSQAISLAAKFPKYPAIQAAALRGALTRNPPLTPSDVSALLKLAEDGERMDSHNAFFPAIRACLLFKTNQNASALSALRIAAERPRWDTYVTQQVRGAWRLSDAAAGRGNTAGREMMMADTSFGYAASLVDGARVATDLAVYREAHGDVAGGYAVRRALLRLGETIRRQDTAYIGALVGAGIQQSALFNLPTASHAPRRRPSQAPKREELGAYLRSAGQPGDIGWAVRQMAAQDTLRRAVGRAVEMSPRARLMPFSGWYRTGTLLLKIAGWLGLVALMTAILARWRWANSIVGGFREAAVASVIAMSLLLIAYGCVGLFTLRAATRTNNNLAQMMQSEGRFYATLTGQTWPD